MKKAYSSLVLLILLVAAIKVVSFFGSYSYSSTSLLREIQHREALQQIEEEKHPKSYIISNPDIPYVGMPESMINQTGLGKYDYKHEYSAVWGVAHEINTYSFYNWRHLLLSCETDNGVVKKVNDYRDQKLYSTINRDKN